MKITRATPSIQPGEPLIKARDVTAGYGRTPVLHGIDLEVCPGEVVALLGANGAGKTTTVLTLAGELAPSGGELAWLGADAATPLHTRARQGLALVTEERSVLAGLTVRRNLRLGRGCDVAEAVRLFPELGKLAERKAGLLSGGEQQMLTLARALARPTRLLLADELSLGLAPLTVNRLLLAIRQAADKGMGALVVEQQIGRILNVADRVYVMRNGRIEFSGDAATARAHAAEIEASYLGEAALASLPKGSRPAGASRTGIR